MCALALFVSQAVFSPSSYCASASGAVSKDELTKQEGIYQSKGGAVPSGYVIGRSLDLYHDALRQAFGRSLASLAPTDRWLDIGAGEGHAILDYCTPREGASQAEAGDEMRARAVAISIEDRRTARWHETVARVGADQIQYLFGKTLRQYSMQELGKFKLITDVMGGFSYSTELSTFMERALSMLELNGSFHTVLADVHSESGRNVPHYPDASYLTEITSADGAEVKVCSWLKRISCVQVTCEFNPDWTPPVESYHIRKVCDDVKVPALAPVHYQAGTPPERRYRLSDPLRAPTGGQVVGSEVPAAAGQQNRGASQP